MEIISPFEQKQKLNRLIEQEKTGTPEELAQKLGISKRQLHNLVEALKNIGADIEYTKNDGTYRFNGQKVKITFSLSLSLFEISFALVGVVTIVVNLLFHICNVDG